MSPTTARADGTAGLGSSHRRKRFTTRHLRVYAVVGVSILGLVAGGVFAAAWYFSSQLLCVSHNAAGYNLTVLARGTRTVTLTPERGIANGGRFGLFWPGGHAAVGPSTHVTQRGITRPLLGSTAGLRTGGHARYSVFLYRRPTDLGLAYHHISYQSGSARPRAWYIPGSSQTWAILVHGRASSPAEGIRVMPIVAGLGMPILDISYRNDRGAPYSPDHLYHLGGTEWMDLQGAVRYALAHGARSVVLFGYSMGGDIVETFMRRSPLSSKVRGIVLDAPALDWYAILNLAASERGLPSPFAAVVDRVVAWRIGLFDLNPVDPVVERGVVKTPTLLFQGSADDLVPPASNRRFAREQAPWVKYVSVRGAGHVQSWNVAPRWYDRRLRTFLRHLLHP